MFTSNSCIEKADGGILFYEQDILVSSYLFEGDLIIDLSFDYLNPGFGIALMDSIDRRDGLSAFAYLYRIGHGMFTVDERHIATAVRSAEEACFHESGETKLNQHIRMEIKGKRVTFSIIKTNASGADVSEVFGPYIFPHANEGYYVGVYSSKGNILRAAAFSSGVPENWTTSIVNTIGGRISFFDDGFKIENCAHDAELEQGNISLTAGKYYVIYDKEKVDGRFDIDCTVFPSGLDKDKLADMNLEDEHKQLLQKDNSFELTEDALVNIKFKGTSGRISNIRLGVKKDEAYVRTHANTIVGDSSWIDIDLAGLSKVEWTGVILSAPPYDKLQNPLAPYSIAFMNGVQMTRENGHVELGAPYRYRYDVASTTLTATAISTNISAAVKLPLNSIGINVLRIFENITGFIYELILTDLSGRETNVLISHDYHAYVPPSIQSPIIVVDENGTSLELSASYREAVNVKWRIDIFNKYVPIELSEPTTVTFDEIEVYGIPAGQSVDIHEDEIEKFCPAAIKISDSSYTISDGAVTLDENVRAKYRAIAVRYQSNSDYTYEFTNVEREIFPAANKLVLTHNVLYSTGAVQIYGIPEDAETDIDKLYRIPRKGMVYSIDHYTDLYDSIDSSHYTVVYGTNEIHIDTKIVAKYKEFIVDYAKDNSYTVNYSDDIDQYEVDVSSEDSGLSVVYDMTESGAVSRIVPTDFVPDENKYLVLRRDN